MVDQREDLVIDKVDSVLFEWIASINSFGSASKFLFFYFLYNTVYYTV